MEKGILDKKWLDWLNENIARGCNTSQLVDTLRKNGFSYPAITKAMGAHFPAHRPEDATGPDYAALARIPPLLLEKNFGATRIPDNRLQLFVLDQFLTEAESDKVVKIIHQGQLRPSTVTVYEEGFRTSKTSDLSLLHHPFIRELDKKIADALGINPAYSEGIQAQKYDVHDEFKAHTDYFKGDTYQKYAAERGNRTWTFMIYLNTTPKGGGTQFKKIGHTFFPQKGRAVAWNNLHADGLPNPDTLHWGMPVEEGEKIIITKWFREKGPGLMFSGT